MDLAGLNVVQLTSNTFTDREASFSPDGSKIVFFTDRTSPNSEVFVMNANGSNPVNISNSVTNDGSCSWSADGQEILFISSRDGNTEVYVMNADGTGQTRLTFNTNFENTPMSQPIRQ
jgi:TolB protein